MRDTELYAQILGVTAPWCVTSVRMESAENRISIEIDYDPDANTPCPKCSKAVKRHDHRKREWRHLDTCQLETRLVADVPRTSCPAHGVLTMQVPWAGGSSRFTVLFEALVIDWLKEAPVAAVARRVRMTWDEVALAGPHLVPPPAPAVAAPLTVSALGMHLHAATTVDGRDRKRLERVCRDLLRPPFVHDAVQALPDDRVRVHFKAPWRSGAAHADIRMTYQRKSV